MPLVLTNLIGDIIIFISYSSMPLALIYFARRRQDFPYRWLLWMFAAFIMACGTTHLMSAIVVWQPLYWIEALLKAVTAVVSVVTAVTLWPLLPQALRLPSPNQLKQANEELQREILERKHVEESLRQAKAEAEEGLLEERLLMAAIVQSSEDAIIGKSLDGIVTSWNPAAEKIFGYSTEEIIGCSILTLIPPERRAEEERVLASIKRGEPIRHFETVRVCKDGSQIAVSVTVSPIRNKEGQIIGASKIARDITEQKKTDTNLRLAAASFESADGMIICDAQCTILRVNQAFVNITGYSNEEAVGQKTNLLNSGRQDEAFYATMWETINREGTWHGELWNRRKNGEIYPEWLSITAVKGADGAVTHYIGTFTDITNRKEAEEQIKELAFYDQLTGLPNRRLLLDRLRQALAASARNMKEGGLMFIDLDNFKTLNDEHGHAKGDLFLKQVAHRLMSSIREGDTVARLGGDEFVVMLEDLSQNPNESAEQIRTVGEKIITALNQPYDEIFQDSQCTASIGAVLFGDRRENIDEIMKQADIAMYQAKAAGRNTLRFFDPELQTAVKARASLEIDMRKGLQKGQFFLYYQPQVDSDGKLTGAEALMRWHHPEHGLVPPAKFIPLAEETGLILLLGQWALETGCAQILAWESRPETAHLTLAVNVSARQFHQADFVEKVLAAIHRTGANPHKLKLELTESMLVKNVEEIINKMSVLRACGLSFSLDDFGTGYSSLSYLKRLPLSQLKIDQSFVRDILTDPNDAAIAHTIITLAQSLGLAVIAEGVETEAQRDFLSVHGCHSYQGYLFGRPIPVHEFDQLSDENSRMM